MGVDIHVALTHLTSKFKQFDHTDADDDHYESQLFLESPSEVGMGG